MYEKPVTHAGDAVGGCIDSTTPGMGRRGLQPHTATGTVLFTGSHSPHQLGDSPQHARIASALSSTGKPKGDSAPQYQPAQNRCPGATGMGHALTQPFTGERFRLPHVMTEEEETPRVSRDANASQTTVYILQALQDCRRVRKLSQAEAETRRDLDAMGQPVAITISSTSQTCRCRSRRAQPSCHTCPVALPCLPVPLESHTAERPPHLNSLASHCCHVPATLHKYFGERELKGTPNPPKRHSHLDGTRFPVIQQVTMMPQPCQRCQHQQPRLQICVSSL